MSDYKRKYRFKSKYRNQVLTIKPSQNNRESESKIPVAGEQVQFSEHYYETEDPAIAERIMKRVRSPIPGSRIDFMGEVYLCPEPACNAEFEDVASLEQHTEEQHNNSNQNKENEGDEQQVVCPECGDTFDTPQQLNGHMIKHRREAKV